MDLQKLRAIAGLPAVRQTVQKPSHDPVLESGDARFIVSYLRKKFAEFASVNVKVYETIKEHLQTDVGAANFAVLNEALSLVTKRAAFEQRNSLRKMAGLPLLSEEINTDEDETDSEEEEVEELDSEDKKEVEDAEQDDAEEDDADADKSESEEKDDAPDTDTNDVSELVAAIANKLLKDGAPEESELADFLMKVYQAGAADAVSKSAS